VPLELVPLEFELELVLLPAAAVTGELPSVLDTAENGLAAPEPHPTIEVMAMRPALSLSTT
jgi:hypothetical protein